MAIQITETELAELNAAQLETADIARLKAEIAEREKANDKFYMDFTAGLVASKRLLATEINKVIPGVGFSDRVEPELEPDKVLGYALQEENFKHVAPALLSIKRDSMSYVTDAVLKSAQRYPALLQIFEVDGAAAKAAARSNRFGDMPVKGFKFSTTVSIKVKDLMFGESLGVKFDVVGSLPAITPEPAPSEIKPPAAVMELDF